MPQVVLQVPWAARVRVPRNVLVRVANALAEPLDGEPLRLSQGSLVRSPCLSE